MIIAIDFDGTVVTHEYPSVGKDIDAVSVLEDLIYNGHKLILNTMRSGKELSDAIKWFESKGIELYGVNENPTQKSWTTSPKVLADLYIDDAALGIPLIKNMKEENVFTINDRPYVDWVQARKLLIKHNIIL